MKRRYLLFQSYFAYSLVCGLVLTLGNLKAQILSSGISVDSTSCKTEIPNHSVKSFIIFITQVSNTEFVNVHRQKIEMSIVGLSSDRTHGNIVTEKLVITKKKVLVKKYSSVKSENFFKIPIGNSNIFFAHKKIYKSVSFPQSNQFNENTIITNNLDFKVRNISVDSLGFTLTIDIPDKIFSEASSIRPPPEVFI